jgi:hypothetical protein
MRVLYSFVAALFLLPILTASSQAQSVPAEMLRTLDNRFQFFHVQEREGKPTRFIYADWSRMIRVFEVKDDKTDMVWESPVLGSPISSMIVEDIDGNGVDDLIVSTHRGRIVAWETGNFDFIGENLLERFTDISCMAVANLDDRGGMDVVFIAEGWLNIYDISTRQRLWRSDKPYAATEMLLAQVDTDPQLEIILNSGYIIDSRFWVEEIFYQEGFGVRMTLVDLNGDGIPEIVGETIGRPLIIFDIYGEREMFPRW